jgi:hypothetical protein
LRTLPYLKIWWQEFKDKGFILLGIHTPEFEFEKEAVNVEKAVEELGVTWPVVLDNEYANWNNFTNRYWPAKYLADREGKLVYQHFGEGAYRETEKKIRELLSMSTSLSEMSHTEHEHGAVCITPTPEVYCGYLRGRISNLEGFHPEVSAHYAVEDPMLLDGTIGLSGLFTAKPEYVESSERGAKLSIRFHGTEVNLVMHPVNERARVHISLDNAPLSTDVRGRDVDDAGEAVVHTARLYNLVRSRKVLEGVLSLELLEGGVRAYAFTFSGCEE